MVFVILLLVGLFAVAAFKIANEKDKDDWIRKLNDK